jgi:PhnB protein
MFACLAFAGWASARQAGALLRRRRGKPGAHLKGKDKGIGVKKKAAKKSAKAKTTRKTAPSKARKSKKVLAIPKGYRTITAHLVCRNAAGAMAFYTKAFGAKARMSMPTPDGKVAHAEMQIGDSLLMVADEMPEMGATAPETIGGSAVHMFLYVKDVDAAFARAVAAGAKADMPPMNMFWGDRYAKLTDPFGHKWSIATHVEDMSPKEMARRGAEAFAKGSPVVD